ncbi:E3 ubiquitin-protein ligase Mdm2-like [Chelonus insularis]|uniref:E3 ubiquitin-protein ligase Mdm2-like n=1 Tax=Chelonus insularis TaxID=460826 RepID=UPI00158E7774|nr:E3 ubiquitin-protein ligase Mdm2-like [Chelonus insularis]
MSLANLIKPSQSGPLKPASNSWKRDPPDEDKDNSEPNAKRPRYSWYVTLESESSRDATSNGESDNESIHSIQDQETEYARDTSDTSTWISTSDEYHPENVSFQVEYDVESLSESDNPFLNISSSDPEDILTVGVFASLSSLSDSEVRQQQVEDTDVSLTSEDSEISKADYWSCIQCNMKNNNPLFRYCERCYQLRKNFFPPRPKRKRKHDKKPIDNKLENETASENNSQQLSRMDSGLGGSSQESQSFSLSSSQALESDMETEDRMVFSPTSCSNNLISKDASIDERHGNISGQFVNNPTGFEVDKDEVDAKVTSFSLKHLSGTDTISVSNDKKNQKTETNSQNDIKILSNNQKEKSDESENKLCLVCTVSPKNGAFVHGSVSHICCCYQCAVRIWRTTKHCPICKRKITNVLKAFYV